MNRKPFYSAFVLLACVVTLSLALVGKAADPAKDSAPEISKLLRSWDDAYKNKDTATLERLFSDDFVGVWADGTLTRKAEEISNLQTGKYKLHSIQYKEERVKIYGNTAVARTLETADEEYEGKREKDDYWLTIVLVKTGNDWKIVACQSTKAKK